VKLVSGLLGQFGLNVVLVNAASVFGAEGFNPVHSSRYNPNTGWGMLTSLIVATASVVLSPAQTV
jgi:hypothetical protein